MHHEVEVFILQMPNKCIKMYKDMHTDMAQGI